MEAHQVAILIDGGFFLKRLKKCVPADESGTPEAIARWVRKISFSHVTRLRGGSPKLWQQSLYRIFFYDALPYTGKAHHPIDNRSIEFGKSSVASARRALFDQLRKERKLALRLGKVNRDHDWALCSRLTKPILKARLALGPLQKIQSLVAQCIGNDLPIEIRFSLEEATELLKAYQILDTIEHGDVTLGLRQKGVDMRIAIDIASLALKKQVRTIVLVSGDSDFVPAAKLARREGIEFILDPLWQSVNEDLFEHIDGLQSGFRQPQPS